MLCYRCGSHVQDGAVACWNCGAEVGTPSRRTARPRTQSRVSVVDYKIGDLIAGRFLVEDVLGTGGTGLVCRVRDQRTGADLALKVINAKLVQTADDQHLFSEKMAGARQLDHKNIVRVIEEGLDGTHPYITMQFLDGLSLRKIIDLRKEKGQVFTQSEVEPIFVQLSEALSYAHRNFYHGNLKPDNVIVLPDLLKVTDFGLIQGLPLKPFLAVQKQRGDSFRYLAPEVRNEAADINPAVDIYSLGVILGEMLTGIVYDESRPDALHRACERLGEPVGSAIIAAVARSAKDRPKSVDVLLGALRGAPAPRTLKEPHSSVELEDPTQRLDVAKHGVPPSWAASELREPTGSVVVDEAMIESQAPALQASPDPVERDDDSLLIPPVPEGTDLIEARPHDFLSAVLDDEQSSQGALEASEAFGALEEISESSFDLLEEPGLVLVDSDERARIDQVHSAPPLAAPSHVTPADTEPPNGVYEPLTPNNGASASLKKKRPMTRPRFDAYASGRAAAVAGKSGAFEDRFRRYGYLFAAAVGVVLLVLFFLVFSVIRDNQQMLAKQNEVIERQNKLLLAARNRESAARAAARAADLDARKAAEEAVRAEAEAAQLEAQKKAEAEAALRAREARRAAEAEAIKAADAAGRKEAEARAAEARREQEARERAEVEAEKRAEKARARAEEERKARDEAARRAASARAAQAAAERERKAAEKAASNEKGGETAGPDRAMAAPTSSVKRPPAEQPAAEDTPPKDEGGALAWRGAPPPDKPLSCPKGMTLVRGGAFMVGASQDDPERNFGDQDFKSVELEAFCVDYYEYPNGRGRTPSTSLTWSSAEARCKKRGKRLCTEEEWEKACKGPGGWRYAYGNSWDPARCNTEDKAGADRDVAGSGKFRTCRSGYNVYDMAGNVAEWTASSRGSGYIVKGGSSDRPGYDSRCASRKTRSGTSKRANLGFRCCSDPS